MWLLLVKKIFFRPPPLPPLCHLRFNPSPIGPFFGSTTTFRSILEKIRCPTRGRAVQFEKCFPPCKFQPAASPSRCCSARTPTRSRRRPGWGRYEAGARGSENVGFERIFFKKYFSGFLRPRVGSLGTRRRSLSRVSGGERRLQTGLLHGLCRVLTRNTAGEDAVYKL